MSLHAACIDSVNIPWILQNLLFPHTSFWWEGFLIFPIIYLTVDLKLICIFGLSDLDNPLIFVNIYPG